MRLFIAVDLPEAVRDVLRDGLGPLKRDQPAARWVRPEGMHITLKFLGEQPPDLVDALDGAVPEVLAPLAPTTVRLAGGGFFPHERRPRVAWIGGDAGSLGAWAAAVEAAAERVGVAREPRPFSLHLTLARLERPWGAKAVEHFQVATGKWRFPEFVASDAVLFQSQLQPSGAVYTPLRRWTVGGG